MQQRQAASPFNEEGRFTKLANLWLTGIVGLGLGYFFTYLWRDRRL